MAKKLDGSPAIHPKLPGSALWRSFIMQNMKEETQTGGSVVIPNLKRKKKNTCQSGWYHWGAAIFFFKTKGNW